MGDSWYVDDNMELRESAETIVGQLVLLHYHFASVCLLFARHSIGGKTDHNAHPHIDSSGKIALVHNGTIDNANELRKSLQDKGHSFSSQTDTEVIAKLIGDVYERNSGFSLRAAVEEAMSYCQGTWVRTSSLLTRISK